MVRFLLFLTILLATYACQREPKLPESPEDVIRKFQGYIDNNQFAEAKTLSTPRGQERLDDLEAIITGELADSTIFNTTFLSINCQITADTARCLCSVRDNYEAYETDYKLIRINGQWLVDVPEEEVVNEEEFIEMLDSMDLEDFFDEEEQLFEEQR
ncbi:MAG TPA: hypothetical protein PKC76_11660 [Saprospiraceae bacterium]|nr:hypothetical protein [Saprospiraceae bacterium]HMP24784.1 hypothetical protein [Saprospiraceae bacterium]